MPFVHSERESASADLSPVSATRGESLAAVSPSSAWRGPRALRPRPHHGHCPAQNSLPSATTHAMTGGNAPRQREAHCPRSPSAEEDRQEQGTAASGCHVFPSLPGHAAAPRTVKQGTQSANLEGGGTAGIALLTHLPLGNRGISRGALSHTDVTNH